MAEAVRLDGEERELVAAWVCDEQPCAVLAEDNGALRGEVLLAGAAATGLVGAERREPPVGRAVEGDDRIPLRVVRLDVDPIVHVPSRDPSMTGISHLRRPSVTLDLHELLRATACAEPARAAVRDSAIATLVATAQERARRGRSSSTRACPNRTRRDRAEWSDGVFDRRASEAHCAQAA